MATKAKNYYTAKDKAGNLAGDIVSAQPKNTASNLAGAITSAQTKNLAGDLAFSQTKNTAGNLAGDLSNPQSKSTTGAITNSQAKSGIQLGQGAARGVSNLEDLIATLNSNNTAYTGKTDAELRQEAENMYAAAYDQYRFDAQQKYNTSDLALQQQMAGLQATYDRQREQSAENYRQNYAQADRQALSRGMQRSSYNNATLANINLAGSKAQDYINETQAAQEKNIGEQRALLSQQLASQLEQYSKAEQQEILAYVDQLKNREYDRLTASMNTQNQLAMQIYEYQFQKEQADLEQSRWAAEFNAQYGGGGGGGGGGRKPKSGLDEFSTDSIDSFIDGLNGNKKSDLPKNRKPWTLHDRLNNQI